MNRAFPVIASALTLSGCATLQQATGPAVPLENVIRQLKHDIGEYNQYAGEHASDPRLKTVCGGKVDLRITAATVSVTTVVKADRGYSVGAELAPSAIVSKIGANAAFGRSVANSETLTFTLEPNQADARALAEGGATVQRSQLYAVLTNLRESLLRASDTSPCLHFPKQQDNSVEFGFTATQSSGGGAGINLLIFAIGYSRSNERTAANTIKIAFEGKGQALMIQ